MTLPLLGSVFALGWTTLACGGAWKEASGTAMGEQCDLLINEVQTRAKDNPNKQQVVTMLSTCKADALANQLNLVGISVFSATLENTLSDGVISDAERLSLETRKNEMAQPH